MLGRIPHASNVAVLVEVVLPGAAPAGGVAGVTPRGPRGGLLALYKPVSGERPLWDFPAGTLAAREVAAHVVSAAGGWDVVPPTVLREGPLGRGSVQAWVGGVGAVDDPDEVPDADPPVVDLFPDGAVPPGWLPVLSGVDAGDQPVVVAHRDEASVRGVAVLDVLINNADRKGSHLLRAGGGVHAIDHGVCFHTEGKLRTVLWGWAGREIPRAELERVDRVRGLLAPEGPLREALTPLLDAAEIDALRDRAGRILASGRHPSPGPGWPSIPWPPL